MVNGDGAASVLELESKGNVKWTLACRKERERDSTLGATSRNAGKGKGNNCSMDSLFDSAA